MRVSVGGRDWSVVGSLGLWLCLDRHCRDGHIIISGNVAKQSRGRGLGTQHIGSRDGLGGCCHCNGDGSSTLLLLMLALWYIN